MDTTADTNTTSCIAYYRVSTKQQGQSGLGLDAQRAAVQQYATRNGLTISQEFTEVETGTSKRERTVIREALKASKETGNKLVIAKLDRLARSVSFISALMDAKVDFVACDMPAATPLTLHIFAALAEHEAKLISQRTKAALDAKKAQPDFEEWRKNNLTDEGRAKSIETRRAKTSAILSQARYVATLLRKGRMSYGKIANELNAQGFKTRRGANFTATAVQRMLK